MAAVSAMGTAGLVQFETSSQADAQDGQERRVLVLFQGYELFLHINASRAIWFSTPNVSSREFSGNCLHSQMHLVFL